MQQMEEMAYNAKSSYVASLVGKNVSAAKFTVSGELKKADGVVEKISLLDGKFVIYVDGEAFPWMKSWRSRTNRQQKVPAKTMRLRPTIPRLMEPRPIRLLRISKTRPAVNV